MAKKEAQLWYPAKGETGVSGYFGMFKILDAKASREADVEIFKEILVLHTQVAGDPDKPGPIKVTPTNQQALANRFPEAWEAWSTKAAVDMPGTPLDALDLDDNKLTQFSLFGIYRMEQLANLSDQQCENIGFGTKTLRNRAMQALGRPIPGTMPLPGMPAQPQAESAVPTVTEADIARMVAEGVAKALAAMRPQAMPTPDQDLADAISVSLKQDAPRKRRGRPPKSAQPSETAAA